MRRVRATLLAAFLLLAAWRGQAQSLRISVVDGASRRPLPSAVLTFLDASGATLSRNITNERGQYTHTVLAAARRVRVLRLGYRILEVPVPNAAAGITRLDIAMVAIPALLEPVTVLAAASCPRTPDATAALALLEQARAGLLESVHASGRSGTNGTFGFCSNIPHSSSLQVRVTDNAEPQQVVIVTIVGSITRIRIDMPVRPK